MNGYVMYAYIFGQIKICLSLQQSNCDFQIFVLAGNKKSSSSILDRQMDKWKRKYRSRMREKSRKKDGE